MLNHSAPLKLLMAIFLAFAAIEGYSQNKESGAAREAISQEVKYVVKGRILEDKAGRSRKVPLSLCRIYVTKPDGSKAARTVTLDDGLFKFSVPDGDYKVLIQNTGHKSRDMELKVSGEDIDLGDICLEIGEEIKAAAIDSKSLVRRKGTRITYDVSKDPDASKISMTEMISRIPDLKMSEANGRLKFENKPVSKILVDNTHNGLINQNRQYPMEFIKADYMKTVELVLPGDIEYNNEQPILLITLAKELPYGFAANLEMKSTTKNSHSPSVDAVVNTPLIGVGVGYEYSYEGAPSLTDKSVREMSEDSRTSGVESERTHSGRSNSHNVSTNFFRSSADKSIKFNATLRASYADGTSRSETRTSIFSADGTKSDDVTTVTGTSKSPFRLNGALRVTGNFGQTIGMRGQKKNQWIFEYAYNNSYRETDEEYPAYSKFSSSEVKEHRLRASLNLRNVITNPTRISAKITGGWYNRLYDDRSSWQTSTDGLDYRQQVCYFDVVALGEAFGKKLGYTLGLNNEYVSNKGSFLNGSTTSPLDYDSFNLNPQFGLNWRFKRGSLGLGYTKTVRRPNVNQLNPYEDRSDPCTVRTGNPDLKGESTDSYSLTFMLLPNLKWMTNFHFSVNYSLASDLISRVLTTAEDGTATSTFVNIGSSERYGVSLAANLKPAAKWSINLMASYQRVSVTLPSGTRNSYDSPALTASAGWNPEWFSVDGTLTLMPSLNSVQTSRLIIEPRGEISISRYFKRPHLGISLNVTDIFHSGGVRKSEIRYDNFTQRSYIGRLGRTYGLRIYWRFGKFRYTESVDVKAYDM